jgi:formylglycine-generating enzyme required for sulfatase activity
LVGVGFFQQALVRDTAAGNALGAVTSNAAAAVIGAPAPQFANMVPIPAGSFLMGSTVVGGTAEPVHQVTVTRPFWIGKYETTQAEFVSVMSFSGSVYSGANLPVDDISWELAMLYCAGLTAWESSVGRVPAGYQYRLPTEAEWEYCCRAGTTTEWNLGNGIGCGQANVRFSGTACVGQTSAVGSYPANPWGLHDMHGNVAEWCLDAWDGSANYPAGPVSDPLVTTGTVRISRSGNWFRHQYESRSAYRAGGYSGVGRQGFRVVLAPILAP